MDGLSTHPLNIFSGFHIGIRLDCAGQEIYLSLVKDPQRLISAGSNVEHHGSNVGIQLTEENSTVIAGNIMQLHNLLFV